MPYTLSATYEIVTPMFIGDARQEAQTVQPASVKGALRFWWRALNWGRVLDKTKGDEKAALKLLHSEEGDLFGKAAEQVGKEQIGGQGGFLLRVIKTKSLQKKSEYDLNQDTTYKLGKGSWQSYLLGLGLMEWDKSKGENLYTRGAITSGTFTVELFCRNVKIAQDIKPALLAWGLLGGLGSRNRKGLGSVAIREFDGQAVALDHKSYCDEIKKLIQQVTWIDDCPPFTAFGQESKMLVSKEANQDTWLALAEIAQIQQLFRGWGFKFPNSHHKVNGIRAQHSSYSDKQNDHGLVYDLADKTSTSVTYPKSTVFGLPRSYGLSGFDPKKEITLEPIAMSGSAPEQKNKRSRRASPLFIHIHKFPSGKSIIIQTFLPAVFLPPDDQIEVIEKLKGGGRKILHKLPVHKKPDWSVVTEYLLQKSFHGWKVVL